MLLDTSIAKIHQDFIAESSKDLDFLAKNIADDITINNNYIEQLCSLLWGIRGGANFLELSTLETVCAAAANMFSQVGEIIQAKPASVQEKLMPLLREFTTIIRSMVIASNAAHNNTKSSDGTKNVTDISNADGTKILDQIQLLLAQDNPVIPNAPATPVIPTDQETNPIANSSANSRSDILAKAATGSELITEDEFYSLVDALYNAPEAEIAATPELVVTKDALVPFEGDSCVAAGDVGDSCVAAGDVGDSCVAAGDAAPETTPDTTPVTTIAVNTAAEALKNSILQAALQGDDIITEEDFYTLLDKLRAAQEQKLENQPLPETTGAAIILAPTEKKTPVTTEEAVLPPAEQKPLALTDAAIISPLAAPLVNLNKMNTVLQQLDAIVMDANKDKQQLPNVFTVIDTIKALVTDLQALQTAIAPDAANPITPDPNSQLRTWMSAIVKSIATKLGKNVTLKVQNNVAELPQSVANSLHEPLMHLLRNAVDHGLEMPEERRKLQKPDIGTISVSISADHKSYHFIIADDGKGIDLAAIKQAAVNNNLFTAGEIAKLSAQECLQLIFKPGISGKNEVSNTSGRGVGMDAVMCKINELKGQIQVESVSNHGTKFIISIPL